MQWWEEVWMTIRYLLSLFCWPLCWSTTQQGFPLRHDLHGLEYPLTSTSEDGEISGVGWGAGSSWAGNTSTCTPEFGETQGRYLNSFSERGAFSKFLLVRCWSLFVKTSSDICTPQPRQERSEFWTQTFYWALNGKESTLFLEHRTVAKLTPAKFSC